MAEIGYASLAVVPTFDKFGNQLEAGTSKHMAAAGAVGGTKFGDAAGKSASHRFTSAVKTAGKVAALGLAAVGAVAVKIGVDAVKGASDLAESTNKIQQIFGDSTGRITKFSAKADKAFGQTNLQARNAAATFGIFGKAAHLTDKQNAKFSVRLSKLASDLASFHNTSPDQAIEALGAALRGESEPMRAYGVLLDDASLKAEALRMGILKPVKDKSKILSYQTSVTLKQKAYNDAVKEHGKDSLEAMKAQAALGTAQSSLQKATAGTLPTLTQQQKVLSANSLIFKQTKVAQGDFARTSDGLANQQRILTASWEDAKTKLGTALLPAVNDMVHLLNDKGIPVVENFADWFGKKGLPKIEAFGGYISKHVVPILGDLYKKAKPLGKSILPEIGDAASAVRDAFKDMAPFVKDVFDAFNGLPSGVKKAIIIGGGALVLKKLLSSGGGGGKGGSGGKQSLLGGTVHGIASATKGALMGKIGEHLAGKIFSVFSKSKPMPVWVVNNLGGGGVGGGAAGAAGAGAGAASKAKFGLGLAGGTLTVAAIVAGAATVGIMKLQKTFAPAATKDGIAGSPTGGPAMGNTHLDELTSDQTFTLGGKKLTEFTGNVRTAQGAVVDLRTAIKNPLVVAVDDPQVTFAIENAKAYRDTLKAVDKIDPLVTYKTSGLAGSQKALDRYIRTLATLDPRGRRTFETQVFAKAGYDTKGGLQARAGGGPVAARRPYLVGEREPELFVPNTPGRILNQRQMAAAGVSGGRTVNVNVGEVRAHDYQDFMRQMQQRSVHAGGGGVVF